MVNEEFYVCFSCFGEIVFVEDELIRVVLEDMSFWEVFVGERIVTGKQIGRASCRERV